jgi:hypothetical protein
MHAQTIDQEKADIQLKISQQVKEIVQAQNPGVELTQEQINENCIGILLVLISDVLMDVKQLKNAILGLLIRFRVMTIEGKQNPNFRQSMLFKGMTEILNMEPDEMQKEFGDISNLSPLIEKYNDL